MVRLISYVVGLGFAFVLLLALWGSVSDRIANPPQPTAAGWVQEKLEASTGSHLLNADLASNSAITGHFDRRQAQRGFQVFKEVCSACHSLRLLAFRDLEKIGYSAPEVKAIANQWQIEQPSPNPDTGENAIARLDHFQEVQLVGRLHRVAVHDMERITASGLMQPGQGPPRAADGVEGAPAQGIELRLGLSQVLPRDLARALGRVLGEILQRQPAQRHGHALADGGAVDVDEFERAAAEIADHAVGGVESGDDAERRQLGLAPAGEEFDRSAAGGLGVPEELGPVGRVARGGGGERVDLARLDRVAEHPEAGQRLERARHRLVGEPPGGEDVAAESAQDLLVVERRRRPAHPLVGDEAHRVRAAVDDRDRAARRPHRRGLRLAQAGLLRRTSAFGLDCFEDLPRPDRLGLVMK